MSKKLLSIAVALVLMLTVFAAVPASAAAGVVISSDFEEGTSDGWSTGTDLKLSLVPTTGYDGNATNAAKIMLVEEKAGVAITGDSPGTLRGNFKTVTWETSGDTAGIDPAVTIEKIDIYVDRANWLDGGGYFSYGSIRFSPQKTDGTITSIYCYSRGDGNDSVGIGTLRDGWNRVVVVRTYPTPGSSVGAKMTAWLNDVLKVSNASSARYPANGKAAIQFYKGTYEANEYLMFDNAEIIYNPGPATIASSTPEDGAVDVDVDTNEITLNFTDAILTDASGDAIEVDNFDISGAVEIEDFEIADDKKSVTLTLDRRLAFETTYTVSVSNVKDLAGNNVSDSVSFTTEITPDFEILKPEFKKEVLFSGDEGETITSLESGYISCEYAIKNYTAADQEALMFIVLVTDGKIEGFIFNPETIKKNGGSSSIYGGFNVTDAANSEIQAYAWDGMKTGKSLMPMVTISVDGIEATGEFQE